jgi:hypothetical protein
MAKHLDWIPRVELVLMAIMNRIAPTDADGFFISKEKI